MSSYGTEALLTLQDEGKEVPSTRMVDAIATQNFVRRLYQSDAKRSLKRSKVNGICDGNPPYSAATLAKAKRAEACNVNWGNARSYMESGSGSFYDLSSEAPSAITFRTSYGQDEQKEIYSQVISEELNRLFSKDPLWDYQMQISQWEMVLHGCGPFVFEDAYCLFPRAVHCGDLKVPERTKSDTSYWDGAALLVTYYPPELYNFIKDEAAATKVGWDVEYTRKVIARAMDEKHQQGLQYDWEFFQQELKNNALQYYDDAKVSNVAHVFWEEFDGRISHAIVERDSATGLPTQYLFHSVGRYANWREAVHPMYYDHGNGGYHHSVTGLGVKMYAAMAYENRLLCNLSDKAFAPKILFSPTTTEAQQKFSMINMGDFAVMPPGFQLNQSGVAGLMNDGLAMRQEITQVIQSTLSSYKAAVPDQKSGNPVTKFEKQMQAALQSALSKTQFNRYYKQLDMLYAEIARRSCNLNTTDKRAQEFQKRCMDKGVPKECFGRIEEVQATRVIGQGNNFTRKQAIDALLPLAGALPEDGRNRLMEDKIAAEAGQAAVQRYYPAKRQRLATEQQEMATLQVAAMKIGVPPVVTSEQNAVVYATVFLKAGSEALASLKQGANPLEVLHFLSLDGPAIKAQLSRFEHDPTRAAAFKTLDEQWQQMAAVTDKLKKQIQQQQQAQNGQQKKTQGAMTDAQIKQAKAKNDIAIKTAKTKAQLAQSDQKHRLKVAQTAQDMQLKDATTAAEIHRNRLKAFQSNGDSE